VLALLKTCADDHPDVLRTPAPMAFFDNFGDSALLFTLRISLPDIAQAARVQSDLRAAILKALRAAEIEIPFNQLDVNLRELDGVKRYRASHIQKGADNSHQPVEPEPVGAGNGERLRGAVE
jgi:small-conductance mechanosensitive channel